MEMLLGNTGQKLCLCEKQRFPEVNIGPILNNYSI